MTKVRIVSDGTAPGTKVTVDGHVIADVAEVRWSVRSEGLAQVTLRLINVELDVDGQMAMKFEGTEEVKTTRVAHCAKCPQGGYCDECHQWLAEQVRG